MSAELLNVSTIVNTFCVKLFILTLYKHFSVVTLFLNPGEYFLMVGLLLFKSFTMKVQKLKKFDCGLS